MAKRNEWTPAQLAQLRSSYGVLAAGEIAKAIGRSKMAIWTKARDLGLNGRPAGSHRAFQRKALPRQRGVDWARLALVIQERCEEEGVTPARQAKELGVAHESMVRFMRGQGGLNATNLLLICEWAGLDPLAFVEDVADLPVAPAPVRAAPSIEAEVAHA